MSDYKLRIKYGDTCLADNINISLESAITKTLNCDNKFMNDKVYVEVYEDTSSKLYLYNKGDECTSLTGGWTAWRYSTDYDPAWTITRNSDNILFTQTSYAGEEIFGTSNKISLTDYNTLHFELAANCTSTSWTTAILDIVSDKTLKTACTTYFSSTVCSPQTSISKTEFTYSLEDIKAKTDSAHIGFFLNSTGTETLYTMWLE